MILEKRMDLLCDDLNVKLLYQIGFPDFVNLTMVNKNYLRLTKSSIFWKSKVELDFGKRFFILKKLTHTWKEYYLYLADVKLHLTDIHCIPSQIAGVDSAYDDLIHFFDGMKLDFTIDGALNNGNRLFSLYYKDISNQTRTSATAQLGRTVTSELNKVLYLFMYDILAVLDYSSIEYNYIDIDHNLIDDYEEGVIGLNRLIFVATDYYRNSFFINCGISFNENNAYSTEEDDESFG